MEQQAAQVMDILLGFVRAQSMNTAIKLGIPERFADGAVSAETIASQCGLDVCATVRLLRCLSSAGILQEQPGNVFAATALTPALRESVPGNIAPYIRFVCDYAFTPAQHIDDVVTSGASGAAFSAAHGRTFFELLAQDREAGRMFDAAMASTSSGFVDGVLRRDWSGAASVVDVGGGNGSLLAALLTDSPHLKATLCEQPHVLAEAGPVLAEAEIADRCDLQECDFFQEVPAGGDVYIMARVLHNWDDAHAVRILQRVRQALPPTGRLLIAEQVLAAAGATHWTKTYDLFISLLLTGNERTEDEWVILLARAGFTIETITAAGWRCQLIECVPDPDWRI
ncbi:methyltransferase [Streptosporangium sp. LJ11]|uniref:methyltransferase n=1 Tax=Streptosporangium sp. LJ11 TaxID=3436927 RepID=UPI003F7A1B16